MKKKEIIYTCIDLTKKEAEVLMELLTYEKGQLTELIAVGQSWHEPTLQATKSILNKLKN